MRANGCWQVAMNGYSDDGVSVFFENREILAKGYGVEERELEERKRLEREGAVGKNMVESMVDRTVKGGYEGWVNGREENGI